LTWLLPDLIEIKTLLAAFIGGALIGLLGMILEYGLGVTPPIMDDAPVGD
jgi:hypothetical protein